MAIIFYFILFPNKCHKGVPIFVRISSNDFLHDPRRGLQQLRALTLPVRDGARTPSVELIEGPADLHKRRVVDLHGDALRRHLALAPDRSRLVLGLEVGELHDRQAPLPRSAQLGAASNVPREERPLSGSSLLGLDEVAKAVQTSNRPAGVGFKRMNHFVCGYNSSHKK